MDIHNSETPQKLNVGGVGDLRYCIIIWMVLAVVATLVTAKALSSYMCMHASSPPPYSLHCLL